LALSCFHLTLEGDVRDDEMDLANVGLKDSIGFKVKWLQPPVARLYFIDQSDARRVFDVK
jgi:hypothetical protein